MDEIYEGTTAIIGITFYNENGALTVPNSATFLLYDKSTGVTKHSGDITVTSSTVSLVIAHTYNTILNQANRYEQVVLLVRFIYDNTLKHGADIFEYQINNLSKVP